MRLVTFETYASGERIGAVLDSGDVLDLTAASDLAPAFMSMLALIEAGAEAWDHARRLIAVAPRADVHARHTVRLRAPLPKPVQMRDAMCFHGHIVNSMRAMRVLRARAAGNLGEEQSILAENGPPARIHFEQPVWYKANRMSVGDPDADIIWPQGSILADFELELAAVIGRPACDLSPEAALDHVFGYTIFNDFSARDLQARETQGMLGPSKSKDFDGGNVLGPCIVTSDEIDDPQTLSMRARINGEVWCDGHSSSMYWSFAALIAYISRGETIHPGEIIASGTVDNGCGLEQLRFLKDGDLVELEIERIGVLRNHVRVRGGS